MGENMHELTIGEQRILAQVLRSQNPLVWSDDIAPADVNILPMTIVVEPVTVDRCVEVLRRETRLNPVLACGVVLSKLGIVTTDIGCGSTKHGESQVGGTTTGAPSGADYD